MIFRSTSIVKIVQLKADYRQAKKETKQLQDELDKLRNLSVEEAVSLPDVTDKPTK